MTTPARQAHRVFPSGAASVSGARHWVGGRLAGARPDLQATVGLLVSELAANAVQHGGTPFTVRVDRSEDRVRVEVTDEGGGRPQLRERATRAVSGRGLRLVDDLAAAWGVREGPPPSTTVWFTVRARS
jgi:anti-sigma regulatory factor (Ser/Thr protein kinase)